jgi:hypothetical protein
MPEVDINEAVSKELERLDKSEMAYQKWEAVVRDR